MKRTFQPHTKRRKLFTVFVNVWNLPMAEKVLASRRAKGRHKLTISDEKSLK